MFGGINILKCKVILIFGTRPEAIKLAPVILRLRNESCFLSKVIVTAQHREMLDQVLNLFGIYPDYDLNIMKSNQHPLETVGQIIEKLRTILESEKPDIILVQGDTSTTFAAAFAAFHFKIPIGHIEAGLRTNNKFEPFPEEINRRLTTLLSDWHFAPTEWAKRNLVEENIPPEHIFVTGNTVIDSLFFILKTIKPKFPDWLNKYIISDKNRLILVTMHRRENWGYPLINVCSSLKKILYLQPNVIIAFSVHMNPNVRNIVISELDKQERLFLLEPMDYATFIHIMANSYFILTDSGGIQEEAPSLGKPVLVLRNTTERPEGVVAGILKLIGTNTDDIVSESLRLLNDDKYYNKLSLTTNIYGDGKASVRIIKILTDLLLNY